MSLGAVLLMGLMLGIAVGIAVSALYVASGRSAGKLMVDIRSRHTREVRHVVEHQHWADPRGPLPTPPPAPSIDARLLGEPAGSRGELARSRSDAVGALDAAGSPWTIQASREQG